LTRSTQIAKAIALECRILDPEADAIAPNLIKGKTFRSLSDEEREEVAEKISVWYCFSSV